MEQKVDFGNNLLNLSSIIDTDTFFIEFEGNTRSMKITIQDKDDLIKLGEVFVKLLKLNNIKHIVEYKTIDNK